MGRVTLLLTPDDHKGRKGLGAAVVLGPHGLGPVYPFVGHGGGRGRVVFYRARCEE